MHFIIWQSYTVFGNNIPIVQKLSKKNKKTKKKAKECPYFHISGTNFTNDCPSFLTLFAKVGSRWGTEVIPPGWSSTFCHGNNNMNRATEYYIVQLETSRCHLTMIESCFYEEEATAPLFLSNKKTTSLKMCDRNTDEGTAEQWEQQQIYSAGGTVSQIFNT